VLQCVAVCVVVYVAVSTHCQCIASHGVAVCGAVCVAVCVVVCVAVYVAVSTHCQCIASHGQQTEEIRGRTATNSD